jgi:nucleoside phosphorylase
MNRDKRLKLLIVAAWEPELTRFRERLLAAPRADVEVVLDTLGVGLVEAAIGMTRCVERHRPAVAVLIGTCGAFAGERHVENGAVVCGAAVHLADASVADGRAALPAPLPAAATFDAAVHAALVAGGARSVQIANTVGITTDDALAVQVAGAGVGADVEHLEAFGFARACAVAAVPCGAVLGVANVVGSAGRSEWLANQASASAHAADAAFDALDAIVGALRTSTTERSPERA